jgi:hypothetical protein
LDQCPVPSTWELFPQVSKDTTHLSSSNPNLLFFLSTKDKHICSDENVDWGLNKYFKQLKSW